MYEGERFNSISHLIGAIAALIGLVVLLVHAVQLGDPWQIAGFSIYGITLLTLYVASTLYHSLKGRAKRIFRKLDHHAIYLLIAGTYTPFSLVTLRGFWGWLLLALVWSLALLGMLLEFRQRGRERLLSLVLYLIMGWLILIALAPLLEVFPAPGVAWLLVGGLCYTLGVVFYLVDGRLRHAHGIWHLFTLAGSTSHYLSVLLYVG